MWVFKISKPTKIGQFESLAKNQVTIESRISLIFMYFNSSHIPTVVHRSNWPGAFYSQSPKTIADGNIRDKIL